MALSSSARTTTRQAPDAASRATPTRPSQDPISQLQRTVGNRAVQRLIAQRELEPTEPADDLGGRIAGTSGGQPLQADLQRSLETHLNADLSSVRVHTDSRADSLARDVNATAFTSGSNIFFRAGAYNPASRAGRETLAHEAVHAVQQAAGPVAGTATDQGVSISSPDDAFERAAADTAARIVDS
jgi:hypothetical protein